MILSCISPKALSPSFRAGSRRPSPVFRGQSASTPTTQSRTHDWVPRWLMPAGRKRASYTTRALRISPRDPFRYLFLQFHALALFVSARYAESAEWSQKSLQERPSFAGAMRTRVASLALGGDIDRAQTACADLARLHPRLTLSWVEQNADMSDEPRRRFIDGLRLADFPNDRAARRLAQSW